jgi:multidrug transporter EmrE-like cation transporter
MGPWIYLAMAIVLEIVATTLLKLSDGLTKWGWGALSLACYAGCFWVFSPALKAIPMGVAYAIWAGVGIVSVTLIGAVFFGQRLGAAQWGFLALIVVGSIGLRLSVAE